MEIHTKWWGVIWNKSKNLLWLKDNIESIQKELNEEQSFIDIKLRVPNFEFISTEIFREFFTTDNWKLSYNKPYEEFKFFLMPYIDKYNKKEMIIRSSAINSEDGKLTGAWIYDSVTITYNDLDYRTWVYELKYWNDLKKEKTIFTTEKYEDAFIMAVYYVYKWIVSDKAIEYRKINDILDESMSIIIQDFTRRTINDYDYNYYSTKYEWYAQIDTSIKNNPDLLRVMGGYDGVMIFKKENLISNYLSEVSWIFTNEKDYWYWLLINHITEWVYPYDLYKLPPIIWYMIARLWLILKEKFWDDCQVELAFQSKNFKNIMEKLTKIHIGIDEKLEIDIDLFQIRKLPDNYKERKSVEFPKDKEPLFEWYCFSIWDYVLDNLDYQLENKIIPSVYDIRGLDWVYTMLTSYGQSEGIDLLPKSGAVIMLNSAGLSYGHIETICAERDILCIFNKKSIDDWTRTNLYNRMDGKNRFANKDILKELFKYPRLQVISNGIIWRIYWV